MTSLTAENSDIYGLKDIPIGTLPIHQETNVEEYDCANMFHIASARHRILGHTNTLELILYSTEFRFLELKLLLYQWRHQYLLVSCIESSTKAAFLLAQRVIRQFQEYITKFTNFHPIVPEGSTCDETIDSVLVKCKDPGNDDMNSVAVAMVVDMLIVIEVYERKIECLPGTFETEQRGKCLYSLTDVMTWYEKLTFFMKTIVKALKPRSRLMISIKKSYIPNRNDDAFLNIAILPTICYEETIASSTPPQSQLQSPEHKPKPELEFESEHEISEESSEGQSPASTWRELLENKLDKILSGYTFPSCNDFNEKDILRYFNKKWNESMTNREAIVHHGEEDKRAVHKRNKRQRQKGRKTDRAGNKDDTA